ncbi:MAG: hypothetical protein ACRCZ2_00680 [Fusobacteriaceae bacterium]
MKIKLNKYGYIESYCIVGDLEGSEEYDFNPTEENILFYQLIDGVFVYNPIPDKPNGLKLEYNGSEWIETASAEEMEDSDWNSEVEFYNSELEFASKATAELACEIITTEMFEDVKLYMKEIDPYRITKKKKKKGKATVKASRPQRPPVFDRYN